MAKDQREIQHKLRIPCPLLAPLSYEKGNVQVSGEPLHAALQSTRSPRS